MQVALARRRRRSRRPRAAAARRARAPRRRPRARGPRRRGRCAASSANARENSRSPVAVAISRPAVAHDGRPAAAQRRGVEHVVVDERGRVDELDRDRGAQHAVVARLARSPAARKTSSGRSRLPPARIVAPACSASTSPCEAASCVQPLLEALHQPGTCAPPASTSASTCLGAAHAHRPGVQRDDPAGGEDPADVGQARRRPSAPASASGPGKRLTEFGR